MRRQFDTLPLYKVIVIGSPPGTLSPKPHFLMWRVLLDPYLAMVENNTWGNHSDHSTLFCSVIGALPFQGNWISQVPLELWLREQPGQWEMRVRGAWVPACTPTAQGTVRAMGCGS